jgi:hypothetical protein
MEAEVENMLDKGIIRASSSPWSAPAILVPNKTSDGKQKYRFCVDFRALNAATKFDPYPQPVFEESTSAFFGSRYFSVLDCYSGFWQVPIDLYVPCILYIGQTHRYSPEYAFYIFRQQIYLMIFLYLLAQSPFIPPENVTYCLKLPFLVHKIFTFYIHGVHLQGQRVKEGHKERTGLTVPQGHYEFNRLPFGLSNSPSNFQRLMDRVLKSLVGTE